MNNVVVRPLAVPKLGRSPAMPASQRQLMTDEAHRSRTAVQESEGSSASDFGSWLKVQLRARNMTQRQLADRAGVHHSTISRLVPDVLSPSLSTATKLIQVLGDFGPTAFGRHETSRTIARVEYALRADEQLTDQDVREVMCCYLGKRRRRPASAMRR